MHRIWIASFAIGLLVYFSSGQTAGNRMTATPELLPREVEMEMALSAAPEHLRAGAGVYVLEKTGFVKVRESSNRFTCVVNRDHPLNQKPTCYDAEGTATILPKTAGAVSLLPVPC